MDDNRHRTGQEQQPRRKPWQFRLRSLLAVGMVLPVVAGAGSGAFGEPAQNVVLNSLWMGTLIALATGLLRVLLLSRDLVRQRHSH